MRKASEQLHVTQPAISRQIQDLEESIGATLFERSARGLKLTAAGEAYRTQAQDILARVEAANRLARRIASGEEGHLRIGFVENAAWTGVVSHALSTFKQSAPLVSLELLPMNTPEQLAAIAAGQLEGGFCYRFGELPDGLESVRLLDQHVVLAVPEAWPLAQAKTVASKALADTPFVIFPRHVYPAYYDQLLSVCAERGLTLNIQQEASTETAILSLVSAGVGAAIVNAANQDRPPARVRFVKLRDLSITLPLEFCFPVGAANAALSHFVEKLR